MTESKKELNTLKLLHSIRQIPPDFLTSTEKQILYTLLSCINIDNKTWHPIDKLAYFSSMSFSSTKRNLLKLEQKKFIFIERPKNYSRYSTNHYSLNIDLIMSFSVDKSVSKLTTDKEIGVHGEHRSEEIGIQPDPYRYSNRLPLYKEEEEKRRNKRREGSTRKSRVPLSDSFLPNEKLNELILDTSTKSGLRPEQLLAKFKNIQKSKDGTSADWDAEYENFLLNERPQGFFGNGKGNQSQQPTGGGNSTKFYGVGHSDYDRNQEFERKWRKQQGELNDVNLSRDSSGRGSCH